MIKCIVKNKDNKLVVVIPKDTKITDWMSSYYKIDGDYTTEDIELPTRETIVTITKPVLVRTPMGSVKQNQSYNETWTYFDIPMKSILVSDGDDIGEELSLVGKESEDESV